MQQRVLTGRTKREEMDGPASKLLVCSSYEQEGKLSGLVFVLKQPFGHDITHSVQTSSTG